MICNNSKISKKLNSQKSRGGIKNFERYLGGISVGKFKGRIEKNNYKFLNQKQSFRS